MSATTRAFGVSTPQYAGWVLGTVVGVLIGSRLGDPNALGLDALFPAFFIALLFEEARGRRIPVGGMGRGLAARARRDELQERSESSLNFFVPFNAAMAAA